MDKKTSIVGTVVSIIGPILLMTGFFLAIGIAIGLFLHWLIPKIEVGTGMIAGLIALCAAMFIYWRFTALMMDVSDMEDLIEEQIAEKEEQRVASAKPVIIDLVKDFKTPRRSTKRKQN